MLFQSCIPDISAPSPFTKNSNYCKGLTKHHYIIIIISFLSWKVPQNVFCPINSKYPSHVKSSSSPPVRDTATDIHTGETETSNCWNSLLIVFFLFFLILGVKCCFRPLSDVELCWADLSHNLISAFNRFCHQPPLVWGGSSWSVHTVSL